jgi:hypothetical protein
MPLTWLWPAFELWPVICDVHHSDNSCRTDTDVIAIGGIVLPRTMGD